MQRFAFYCGNVRVCLWYTHCGLGDRDEWAGYLSVTCDDGSRKRWTFDGLETPAFGRSSPAAAARSAVSFGTYYTTDNRGSETPKWAPDAELADTFAEQVDWQENGEPRLGHLQQHLANGTQP